MAVRAASASALYDLRDVDGRDLVEAAIELIVNGVAGDAVMALASKVVTPRTSPFEMDELVQDARDELSMPKLDSAGTALRACQAQLAGG